MLFQRHIFFQASKACAFACVFFVGILLIGNATKDLLRFITNSQMTFVFLLKALLLLVPAMAAYALPLGLVAGVLSSVGRMSSQNEFLILQACGVSMQRIIAPIFLLGFLASFFALGVNLFYAPRAIHFYRKNLRDLAFQDPMRFIQPNCFIKDFPGYILFVDAQIGTAATGVHVWELDSHGCIISFLCAEGGEFFKDATGLLVRLKRGMVERYGKNEFVPLAPIYFHNLALNLPNKVSTANKDWIKPLKHYDLFELMAVLRENTNDNSNRNFQRKRSREFIAANYIIQQHIASAVAIFLFTPIAIYLGIRVKRKESSIGIVFSLALVLGYYLLTIVVSWLQINPDRRVDLAAWAPTLVLVAIAILASKMVVYRN
ncbi:MAG: LptF/LptG family permease [Puniceicoccales bacterium]|jgi:lipopolysaccharide export system permease protein|nr:LptF/LptG family permease [Puniceicoccales bacterium]